jgi:hypothetical protein
MNIWKDIVSMPDESIVELQTRQKYDLSSWLTKTVESAGGKMEESRGRSGIT